MAADSVSQMQQGGAVISTHSSVEKLTEIDKLPIAAMVHGIGAIEKRSIVSLIREFEFDQRKNNQQFQQSTVAQVTNALADFIEQRYNAAQWGPPPQIQTPEGVIQVAPWPPVLGIVVGGYSPGQFFPEVYLIRFPGKQVTQAHPAPGLAQGDSSITWWGVEGPLRRLVLGYDMEVLNHAYMQHVQEVQQAHAAAQAQAAQQGTQPPQGAPVAQGGVGQPPPPPIPPPPGVALGPLAPFIGMPTNIEGMPLQDAVEFADYLGNVVLGYDRFTIGPPSVGGCLDVLAIQPEGLSWYRRKEFASRMAQARGAR